MIKYTLELATNEGNPVPEKELVKIVKQISEFGIAEENNDSPIVDKENSSITVGTADPYWVMQTVLRGPYAIVSSSMSKVRDYRGDRK
jgi:hypothetical protein